MTPDTTEIDAAEGLLDYFAAQAIVGECARIWQSPAYAAERAYNIAEAMMAERNKRHG